MYNPLAAKREPSPAPSAGATPAQAQTPGPTPAPSSATPLAPVQPSASTPGETANPTPQPEAHPQPVSSSTAAANATAAVAAVVAAPSASHQTPGGWSSASTPSASNMMASSAINYRPLNVRDALSYLDQVKVQFSDQPDVYNRFLDVMKEFKGQIIDTPGVIDRVSTLFRGHPSLIQGFNTFLPPGYRIECLGGEGDERGLITVTTPTGTVSQVPGGFAAADRARRERLEREVAEAQQQRDREKDARAVASGAQGFSGQAPGSSHGQAPPPMNQPKPAEGGALPPHQAHASSTNLPAMPIPPHNPAPSSGPSTPSAAHFLASGGLQNGGANSNGANANARAPPAGNTAQNAGQAPMVEFNHAISFVNKIKNRFNSDPETYKQFLEILQTYQRDTKDIAEVYAQVTILFNNAPDLLDEFKQFLPENGSGGALGSFMQAAGAQSMLAPPGSQEKPISKRSVKDKDAMPPAAQKKRRGQADPAKPPGGQRSKKPKLAHKADSPSHDDDYSGPSAPPAIPLPQTLVSPDEVAFFDKVKKHIDDKVVYHEFLKLINLFTQDLIDTKVLVERAQMFIGENTDIWPQFKQVVGADDVARSGGFANMIGVEAGVLENTPAFDRAKLDINLCEQYGPSYRKLPKTEINVACTGRDAMCWEVLNDEWVSHPTWASEDAAPFIAHKKNQYEEALHKSEEERHEYDYHIEANLRTIALLEPINAKIATMDADERAHFTLKAGLGGQSKSIYQRIIKKVYGPQVGPEVIKALHESPVIALPIVLERLKGKDEEWKRAQREWNRVWREQDAKNFYKALDHQGGTFKNNDKKTIAPKTLITEIEALRKEQHHRRAAMIDPSAAVSRPRHQFAFKFEDKEVLKDCIKLVISYLDRFNGQLTSTDKDKIEHCLRDFVPLFFLFDKAEFDADFGDAEHAANEDDEASEADSDAGLSAADDDETASGTGSKRGKKTVLGNGGEDLRKRLLKTAAQEKNARAKRDDSTTPGPSAATADEQPEGSTSIEGTPALDAMDGIETPIPPPVEAEAVAEALEKGNAGADAAEETWANMDTPADSRAASVDFATTTPQSTRKGNFFANQSFYVLIRLIQVLYSRLLTCKETAEKLAKEGTSVQQINPLAYELGLADGSAAHAPYLEGSNPAAEYYGHLLGLCERLFESDVDVNVFEESLRLMYGNKAYIMFTVDKVVAAIIKQTQSILGDMRSQELLALLKRDRAAEKTTTRQQIAYRMQAEGVLGVDENLFKIEWVSSNETLTIQLLGKDDLTIDDASTMEQKWRQYIDSFVLTHPTEGLAHRVEAPLLKRNLKDLPADIDRSAFVTQTGMEMKIGLGSYRLFFLPGTEDFFCRRRPAEEIKRQDEVFAEGSKARLDKLNEFVNSRIAPVGQPAETSAADKQT